LKKLGITQQYDSKDISEHIVKNSAEDKKKELQEMKEVITKQQRRLTMLSSPKPPPEVSESSSNYESRSIYENRSSLDSRSTVGSEEIEGKTPNPESARQSIVPESARQSLVPESSRQSLVPESSRQSLVPEGHKEVSTETKPAPPKKKLSKKEELERLKQLGISQQYRLSVIKQVVETKDKESLMNRKNRTNLENLKLDFWKNEEGVLQNLEVRVGRSVTLYWK